MAAKARILVYVGKGGVGKTTLAASTALVLARRGLRTLVVSTDAAHTLGDLFDKPLLGDVTRVGVNLDALEIHAYREMERRSKEILRYLRQLMAGRGYHDMLIHELLTLPGVDEVVSLMRLKELHAEGRWDAIVVDTAPSGGALKLFVLPEAAHWYMQRVYPGEKKLLLLLKPLAEKITASPLPDAPFYDALERLYGDLVEVKDIFKNAKTTSFRLVVTPERMVLRESMRILAYLSLHGFHTDAVLLNRLPGSSASSVQQVRENLTELPVLPVREAKGNPHGREALLALGYEAYRRGDPLKRRSRSMPIEYETGNNGVCVRFRMPGVARNELKLFSHNGHLVLQARNVRRLVPLPDSFAGYQVGRAKVEKGILQIDFSPRGGG